MTREELEKLAKPVLMKIIENSEMRMGIGDLEEAYIAGYRAAEAANPIQLSKAEYEIAKLDEATAKRLGK
jgi:hypothetical protein